MILVLDVGNTETTIGLFRRSTLAGHWRITTDVARTPDEIGLILKLLIEEHGERREMVKGIAIASVVPQATAALAAACTSWLRAAPLIVDASSPLPIELAVEEPLTVGADRVVNTLAASRLFQRDAIVVDLGTATTFDCITAEGVFLGGAIAPGVRTVAETLVRRTAKLPPTDLSLPERAIGRRTEDCIRAGVLFGASDAIDGMVARIRREWPRPTKPIVVATGGLAEFLRPLCSSLELIEPHLTLIGLRLAFEHLSGNTRSTSRRKSK